MNVRLALMMLSGLMKPLFSWKVIRGMLATEKDRNPNLNQGMIRPLIINTI